MMDEELQGFVAESLALRDLIQSGEDSIYLQTTQFKNWLVEDVIRHLLFWNRMVCKSLLEGGSFTDFITPLVKQMMASSFPQVEQSQLPHLSGENLLAAWQDSIEQVSTTFADVSPKLRIAWAGPDMSARSAVTARLMETWAHGQSIYDLMGVRREDKEHIKGIVTLGINTFAWTYKNRGLDIPSARPEVVLTSPQGSLWQWQGSPEAGLIEGNASEFCQVVAQTRNVKDTQLNVTGQTALYWMNNAQCFAGPPVSPPAPKMRFTGSTQCAFI